MKTPNCDALRQKKCKPCEGGVAPLTGQEVTAYLKALQGWKAQEDSKSIYKSFLMKDFMAAIQLIGEIARTAEEDDHHPDLHLTGYRHLRVTLATHAIQGLSENDFILAAKIDALPKTLKETAEP